jgi:hypothetical protein
MFTKPINEITFGDVESFCKEWTEGVRVEYKRKIDAKGHIPKIVSSFAKWKNCVSPKKFDLCVKMCYNFTH